MKSCMLDWAAVPHNSDGVVFQVRIFAGCQRFHVARAVLEEAFGLAPKASDAKQLELFYLHAKCIVNRAGEKHSPLRVGVLALVASDFIASGEKKSRRSARVGAQPAIV
jgi:hypothetical protein